MQEKKNLIVAFYHFFFVIVHMCVCISFRKRSPKSEDDGFIFPDVNASKKCDFDTLTEAQAEKLTSSMPVAQQHIFAEPKPKVSKYLCAQSTIKTNENEENKN